MALEATRGTLGAALLFAALAAAAAFTVADAGAANESPAAAAPALPTVVVGTRAGGDASSHDGVVQAVRQTVIASQVPGAVTAIAVKAGDTVRAGQVLLRLDARTAERTAAAGAAEVRAARAAQDAATQDVERQRRLFADRFISQAALDRAEAQYKQAQAEAAARLASAGAAQAQTALHVVSAPYDGVVSDVAVVVGDMAMPGRPLITVYDPSALRVSAPVPASLAPRLRGDALIQFELPGLTTSRITPQAMQLLPAVDPATHTLELRLALPGGVAGAVPGMFARVWLPGGAAEAERLFVPAAAVVRRSEMTGLYVLGADGSPRLRQVRLGVRQADAVEVLSGVTAGERVVLDPQAAARLR